MYLCAFVSDMGTVSQSRTGHNTRNLRLGPYLKSLGTRD